MSESVRRLQSCGRQLEASAAMPVFLAACHAEHLSAAQRLLASRFGAGQYCMLAQIGPDDRRIERLWTEEEMLHTLLQETVAETDMESGVDKAQCL